LATDRGVGRGREERAAELVDSRKKGLVRVGVAVGIDLAKQVHWMVARTPDGATALNRTSWSTTRSPARSR
jgi:hypothetical protein